MSRVRVVLLLALLATTVSVRPARAADTWVEVKSEHFTIIANTSEKKARNVAWQFEQVRGAIRAGFPWAEVELDQPVVVLAVKDEDSMRALAPQYWETRGEVRPGSVFVSAYDRHFIAMRADLEVETQGLNPWHQAYWAYSALVLNENFDYRLPLWLTNGLSSLLSNTIVREKEITFGQPIPWLVETARTQPLLRLSDLLTVDRESSAVRRSVPRERFDAQCWTLVQFLMFGDAANGGRINQLSELLLKGTPSTTAVAQVYGSLDAVDQAYRQYVHQAVFRFGRLKISTDTSAEKYPVRPLSAAEAAAERAGFHVAMNRPVEARALLATARTADAAHPRADEVEGVLLEREKQLEAAKQAYEKAIAHQSTNYWVYYRLPGLSAGPGLDAAALTELATRLERATTLNPGFAPAFAYLASIEMQRRQPDRALLMAQKAITIAPGQVSHRILYARLLLATNHRDDAVKIATDALLLARTPQDQAALQSILQTPAPR